MLTTDKGNWEPIEADQLQIGHYIRIDHRWLDHPFVRRSFRISSEREIATIREVQLTRMFVDRATGAAGEPATAVEVDAAAAQLAEAARIQAQRISLDAAGARDRVSFERARALLPALGSADATGASMVDEFVDYLLAILNNSTTPLALLASAATKHSSKRHVLQTCDAVSLVALVGKRMGMNKAQLQLLTQAAATHLLGMTRMPPQLMDEDPARREFDSATFRKYPLLSASILQQCGGFPEEVLRIVREHRERPDGSGFPQRLAGDAIHPLALILGAVREFQIRCNNDTSPLLALAYLHQHCREIHGAEVIGHLASAVLVYPVGTYVQLSDGRIARITRINEAARTSPIVEVYEDRSALRDWITLDLTQCPELSVVRALDTSYLPPRMFETARRAPGGAAPPQPASTEPESTEAASAESAEAAQASGA